MNSDQKIRASVARLRKQSRQQLLISLSRQSIKNYRARHYVGTIEAGTETFWVAHKVERNRSAYIDRPMLDALGAALKQKPTADGGRVILEALWRRVRRRVCDELAICEKLKPGDLGLVLSIWAILHRGQPVTDRDLYLIVAVLAVRLGPDWMCDCSRRKSRAK